MTENPNIGQQFTDMIGHSLIKDSMDSLNKMQAISDPHSDKVFKQHLMSDRDMLDHPAIQVHNNLYHAHRLMEMALGAHQNGNKPMVMHHAIDSHQHLIQAIKGGLQVPGIINGNGDFIGHASDVTQNMTKLSKLYGQE